jgi:hypothetical protein
MARYYKNVPDDSYEKRRRTYGVIGDQGSYSTLDTKEARHPYGEVYLQHAPAQEHPNFDSGGYSMTMDPNPTELFEHSPETLTVDGMRADKRVRPHMMTVMALAQQDHPNAQIVAGSSLTKFSSALSKTAVDKGLIVPHRQNPEMKTMDEIRGAPETEEDFASEAMVNPEHKLKMANAYEGFIPEKEVMKGKQFLKEMLRPKTAPPSAPEPKYEQPRLPGME